MGYKSNAKGSKAKDTEKTKKHKKKREKFLKDVDLGAFFVFCYYSDRVSA